MTPRLARLAVASLAAALTALAFPPRTAAAQFSIGANAGAVIPTGKLGNGLNTGYTVAITLGVQPVLAPVGFRLEGMFNEFGVNGAQLFYNKQRIWGGTGNVIFSFSPVTGGLYAIGGAGYYGDYVVGGGTSSSTNTNFGLNGGLGYRLPLTGFNTYIEARYHTIFSSPNATMVPITFGISF